MNELEQLREQLARAEAERDAALKQSARWEIQAQDFRDQLVAANEALTAREEECRELESRRLMSYRAYCDVSQRLGSTVGCRRPQAGGQARAWQAAEPDAVGGVGIMTSEQRDATALVEAIIADLNDRSGLGLAGIDDATKQEIRSSWITKAQAAIERLTAERDEAAKRAADWEIQAQDMRDRLIKAKAERDAQHDLVLRLRAQHAKPKAWRSGLEARLAEKDDEPAPLPAELEAVDNLEFVRHYTTEELCAWINRLCAETQEASARARALVERMRR